MIGHVIGNYRIASELGKGGMGVVYRAEHVQLGRPAALKMLQAQMSSDPAIVQRFFNEARAASSIDHPGIVEIYDFGTHTDGRAYIVMALLKGESLEDRLAFSRPRLAPLEGATLIVQVTSALAAAHARGIVHRDLKPDNIFLVPNDMMPGGIQVKLLDFGIAKLADDRQTGFKTQTGALIGTPAYMSPEQCMGRSDLDHRTDLYSLGCILFHILCGRPPFLGEQGTGMMIASHLRDAPPDPRTIDPRIPAPLSAIVLRLLEKDPAARFQSAADLKQALVAAGAQGTLSQPASAHGPSSYAQTLAAPGSMASPPNTTTQSGSAAQLMAQPAKKSRAWFGLAAVAAVAAGGAVWLAMRHDGNDKRADIEPAAQPPPAVTAAPTPTAPSVTAPPAGSAPSPTAPVLPPVSAQPPPPPVAAPAKSPPVGAPSKAPPVGAPSKAPPQPQVSAEPSRPLQLAAGKLSFKLDAASYAPAAPIAITFPRAISSKSQSRAWITVVEANKPATQYGAWEYIADGASKAKLIAPNAPGAYEVRLHTEYPAKTTNVVFSVPITVIGGSTSQTPRAQQRFTLASAILRGNQAANLRFPVEMRALPGERFWVTVVKADQPDTSYATFEYVPDGAKSVQLAMPSGDGDYEIRLHANYPTKSTNVVYRTKIHIKND